MDCLNNEDPELKMAEYILPTPANEELHVLSKYSKSVKPSFEDVGYPVTKNVA